MYRILAGPNIHSSDLLTLGGKRVRSTVAFEQDRTGQVCMRVSMVQKCKFCDLWDFPQFNTYSVNYLKA